MARARFVRINDAEQLRAVADALRDVDEKLPNELRYLLRRIARPLMKEQRKAIKRLPGDGGRGIPLRATIAKGLKLTVRTGRGRRGWGPMYRIRTTVPGSRKKPNLVMLPRGLDTEFNGWRSPYFGDRSNWVHHNTHGPSWFMGPAQNEYPKMRRKLTELLQSSADEIARAAKAARLPG